MSSGCFLRLLRFASVVLAHAVAQERERCLLQHGATRLSPDSHPGLAAADRKANDASSPGSRSASGLLETRQDLVNAAEPYRNKDWEAVGALAELSGTHPEPQEAWEADYLVDDQPGAGDTTAAGTVERSSMLPVERDGADQPAPKASDTDVQGKFSIFLEVHIPMRLREVHRSSSGPIQDFLRRLQEQLQVAAGVPESRLVILGVRGEYMNLNWKQLELLAHNATRFAALLEGVPDHYVVTSGTIQAYDCSQGVDNWAKGWSRRKKAWCCKQEGFGCPKETIIDIEVLPGLAASEPIPLTVAAAIARQLEDPQSILRRGPLSSVLAKATLMSQGAIVTAEAVEEPLEPLRSAARGFSPLWMALAGCEAVILAQSGLGA